MRQLHKKQIIATLALALALFSTWHVFESGFGIKWVGFTTAAWVFFFTIELN